ncbi:MAG: hypothetical protein KatS3mg035_1644 [Bacteroidia bacterium]|nr:MAG: hypothetical protein KatS3mg035_1644 [Bacteroidia bacterium]
MKNYTKIDKKKALEIIKKWLEQIIVGWNICPFAKEPFLNNRIRYAITYHKPNLNYFQEFLNEIQFLNSHNQIDTTLWILPDFLNDLPQLYHLITTLDQFLFESKNYKSYQIVFFSSRCKHQGYRPYFPKTTGHKSPSSYYSHSKNSPNRELRGKN